MAPEHRVAAGGVEKGLEKSALTKGGWLRAAPKIPRELCRHDLDKDAEPQYPDPPAGADRRSAASRHRAAVSKQSVCRRVVILRRFGDVRRPSNCRATSPIWARIGWSRGLFLARWRRRDRGAIGDRSGACSRPMFSRRILL